MKTLLLRQVRLLATPALVSMALGLVPLLLLSFTSDWRMMTASPAEIALALVAIVAPWLIAVAAIAPDAESGGLAFLGGLPLARGRHFALRALVALGWSVVATAPFHALCAHEMSWRPFADFGGVLLMIGALAFVAGLAAGAIARQSLGAFITAPLLLAIPLGVYEWFLISMDAPTGFHVAGPIVAAALLVVSGWLGFRDPATTSWRPLVRTAGLLVGAVFLGCGVTTATWARAIVFPERQVQWSTQGPVVVRYAREQPDWPRIHQEWSTTLHPVAALERVRTLDELRDGWVFDEPLRVCAITPDGRVLVHATSTGKLLLLDLGARKVLAREDAAKVLTGWPYAYPIDEPSEQESIAGEPWIVDRDLAVRRFGGDVLHQLPQGTAVEARGGARLVARLPEGERVILDLVTGARTPLDGPSRDVGAVLSPRGRYLSEWSKWTPVSSLTIRDLERAAPLTLPLERASHPHHDINVSFSPNERTALVSWSALVPGQTSDDPGVVSTEPRAAAIDLETGRVVDLSEKVWWLRGWSPSGRRLLCPDGWIDLDDRPDLVRRLPKLDGPVFRFLDDDTILWSTDGRIERIELGRRATGE